MLNAVDVSKILFLDIETAPQFPDFKKVPPLIQKLFSDKTKFRRQENPAEEFYHQAGIFAEFGKVICIGCGYFAGRGKEKKFRIKTIKGHDEKAILKEFLLLLNKHFNSKGNNLCAHNGKEFDFPFLARRILVNKLKLPSLLDISGKKPWEVQLLDTMELWRFGDYKNYTSLELLASIFGIPTPKADLDGSMVHKVYWKDSDLDRIAKYCSMDVLTLASIFLALKGENPLMAEDCIFV